MSETPVRIRGLTRSFGARSVLAGLDLDIPNGQRVAVLGPSGGGKTTLLRILAALDAPDAGTVEIGAERLWPSGPEHDRARRHVGMVFQQFNLFPHLSVLDNLTLAPRLVAQRSADVCEHEALVWLERVGLRDRAGAWPATLSGGQKQRVAIARALMMHPEILCLDEPTSALDPELVGEVVAVVRDLAMSTDMTMVLVTHQPGFAAAVADRIIILADGAIADDGPARRVLEQPAGDRAQRFLGAIAARH
jgi:ABC-type polar amino acid transport system ATPase subunit